MPLTIINGDVVDWSVHRTGVIGPGIVGMPMAALLADAKIRIGTDTAAHVTVLQRDSKTSGWKVGAINEGRSPIGGVEPGLDRLVENAVAAGNLSATHDPDDLRDADVVLVSVQTDKRGLEPDYGPLFEALEGLATALSHRPDGNVPLVVFESTLAPSTMTTLIRDFFAERGLIEGRDLLLGNSPNRVMPGRLVERVAQSDKIVAGLSPATPALIERLYKNIVTRGRLYRTNSMTAEIVKTLENAYRDVRIAFAAEVARYCDTLGLDFYALRDQVNDALAQTDQSSSDPQAVPSGGLLVPTVGVGGHCLPKDGILLWWRALEAGRDQSRSLILEARAINDASPSMTCSMAEETHGGLSRSRVALLGVAYRFDSEDTRNSPTLALMPLLKERGAEVSLHDPYVGATDQNLVRAKAAASFTNDIDAALKDADMAIFCTAHGVYSRDLDRILEGRPRLRTVVDGCNLTERHAVERHGLRYAGIGRGEKAPDDAVVEEVLAAFHAVELGVANELDLLIEFLNDNYAVDDFNSVQGDTVRELAATCVTGCAVAEGGPVPAAAGREEGFRSRLVARTMGVPLGV